MPVPNYIVSRLLCGGTISKIYCELGKVRCDYCGSVEGLLDRCVRCKYIKNAHSVAMDDVETFVKLLSGWSYAVNTK
jgi:hypothetical protein